MGYDELVTLLGNFDPPEVEMIQDIVLRLAGVKADQHSGQIRFAVNTKGGGFIDMHVDRSEVVRFTKKRRIRSKGV